LRLLYAPAIFIETLCSAKIFPEMGILKIDDDMLADFTLLRLGVD